MDIVRRQATKKEMISTVFFSFVILIVNLSFSNVLLLIPPLFLLLTLLFPLLSSNLALNKRGNRYHNKNLFVKLSTILPESIISTHGKTFMKIADLAYFSKLKKHSKVWDHETQLLKVQFKKKYWLCNNCIFMLGIKPSHYLLTLVLDLEKSANFKKNPYIFPNNAFFDKMKTHLWKYSNIDLNKSYSATKDKVFVLSQV